MFISPFRTKSGIDPIKSVRIKDWVKETFTLSDEVAILVTELQCTEEGCPPLETIIAILEIPGQPRPFKLHKAMAEVTVEDIRALTITLNHQH